MAEAATAGTSTRRDHLWRSGRFLRAWGAQSVSEFGDRISELALPLVAVTVLQASATEVGLLAAVVWLPNVVAVLVGAWVDRQPRPRRLLVTHTHDLRIRMLVRHEQEIAHVHVIEVDAGDAVPGHASLPDVVLYGGSAGEPAC